ncbi:MULTISPECIES: rod shape-determining protein RodA [Vitreoscilla]|uniref:Peptidoglycan glycosyltransferase MrdB n=1 Tax=Vitreoscilla stercoraria TaxID=61 RepID=A0ABY4E8I1_VITST|nr:MULTISPECIES: rod shape-determining protein RodA [Vitreoscilla]AUZ04585.1 rod shape-determining protein RodA [Vitreoscilla sp. C1]UOO91715.1 rod shape-determining protein RodA [Vitreoscilla stercoraria]
MTSNHPLKRLYDIFIAPMDRWLLLSILIIYIMSLFLLYSADGGQFFQLEKKTLHTFLGFMLLWGLSRIKPQMLASLALPAYIGGVILLLGVEFFGVSVNGAKRWLDIGPLRIQPSEIMKIGLPMMVAAYFQRYDTELRWYHYLGALGIIGLPVGLILDQPDLGTAVLIGASGIFVMFFAGLSWRVVFVTIVLAVLSMPLMWEYGMHEYQRVRVRTLFNPAADPLGAGYHIIQSMIAIGSGGVWGKGWLNGTQTHLDYIPESTTDFIFAVYAEEFGLIGNILLVAVYVFIVVRGLIISANSRTLYERTVAGAFTMTVFCYAFVNIGMVSGILPVVGVPLPLVSYGGTATLSVMIMLGMLMSIHSNQTRGNQSKY